MYNFSLNEVAGLLCHESLGPSDLIQLTFVVCQIAKEVESVSGIQLIRALRS